MNKTLMAAVSGVAFGAVLGGIAASRCNHWGAHRVHIAVTACPSATPACPAILPPPPPIPADAAAPTPPEAMSIDRQLSQAQTEYVNGNFQRTVDMVLPLTGQSPERAFRILGAAACNLHDAALADRAYNNVHSASRQYLVYVCRRQHMARVDGHFQAQP